MTGGKIQEDLKSISNWIQNTRQNIQTYGMKGVSGSVSSLAAKGTATFVGKYIYNYGEPVFDKDWDILIVLDACRADLFSNVSSNYDWLPEKPSTTSSLGSHTTEWMEKNFNQAFIDEMQDTIYITGNPQSEHYINSTQWMRFYEPWRHHRNELGTIAPDQITDYGIDAFRQHQPDRMILHYMQPHQPFRTFDNIEEEGNWISKDVWHGLQFGEFTQDEVWEGYADNLKWVLDDIKRLLTNVNADSVVITSDHGNALGEFGIYGHPKYVPIPCLKQVPWVQLTAQNVDCFAPDNSVFELEGDDTSVDVRSRLEDLGYV